MVLWQAGELQEVEQMVNQWILEEHPLQVKEVPIAEAKAAGQTHIPQNPQIKF